MRVTKLDKLLFFAVVAASAAAMLFSGVLFSGAKGTRVRIEVAGRLYGEYPLEDKVVEVRSTYGYNRVQISPEGACVTESDCPDGLEMREGTISHAGQALICLPNRLVVTITGTGGGADVTAY